MAYEVKDIKLAPQGLKNINWAEAQMGALLKVRERFEKEKPISGYRIGMALHVTKETAVLVRTLVAGGAEVAITSCNPLSTQDDAAAALASEGVNVFAYKGENIEDYYRFLDKVISFNPQITIDDGMDLVTRVHTKYPQLLSDMICGCEETTTGVIRLRAMEEEGALKYPIIAVNDCQTKHLMDNYYGTGQSSLDGVIRATNLLISGKTVVVTGYGNCGKGVALRANGLGANIIVTEVDPFRALQAKMDGYRVMKMEQAAREGDIFITVSGNLHVISSEHIRLMKDGAVLANSGHFDHEIDVTGLKKMASDVQRIRPLFDQYIVEGKRIYLCGEGRLVNLACAEGHPSMVMSLSFCDQSLGVEWGIRNREALEPKVYKLPQEIDQTVARLQLEAMRVSIDELTAEQKEYLSSWQT
ncbi:MAG: adenosylhomocysteinase, partial [Candidatus Latescibacteria bacterium]|nr:adenosylhomocysteinase [Candidatus Latescibacterota bacterium]